jgi:maltose O-acetyltransferase
MSEPTEPPGRSASATFRPPSTGSAPGGRAARSAFDPRWNLLVNHVAALTPLPPRVRAGIYRAAGIDCRTVKIAPGLWVYSDQLALEVGAFVGWHCRIHNQAPVTLGTRSFLGPEVMLLTTGHDIGPATHRAGALTAAPITIGAGAWVGARTTVLPGVTVGAGAVVAAGSVVTADCEPDGLYAGIPAIRKRDLPRD